MLLQPKMAIAFRSDEEREVIKKVADQQGINTQFLGEMSKGRAYICPVGYHEYDCIQIEIWDYPDDDCSTDENDPFEWTYLEAADVLRNLIIAERRRNAT